MKQHKSHILAVDSGAAMAAFSQARDAAHIHKFPPFGFVPFKEGIDKFPFDSDDIWVGPRQLLESNEEFRQIIPYVIIVRDDKFLLYHRTEKGGESRLHGKRSMGFGGHIDIGDVMPNQKGESIDLETTIANATHRELMEELRISEEFEIGAYGMIIDNSDAVGRVHIGIVMIANVTGMVMSNENQIELLGFKTIDDLIADAKANESELESWTVAIIKHMDQTRGA